MSVTDLISFDGRKWCRHGVLLVCLCVAWSETLAEPKAKSSASNSIHLSVLTYNTHLFGDLVYLKGLDYHDNSRKDQIKAFLNTRPATIVALQEVWSGAFANNFKHDVTDQYPKSNFFAQDAHHGAFNKSGLCLMADNACKLVGYSYFDYISQCNVDGFDIQDNPPFLKHGTGKGFELAVYQLPGANGKSVGVFTTHMVTNASTYPKSVACCFESLASAVDQFCTQKPDSSVVVMGDLNIAELEGNGQIDPEFVAYVQKILEAHKLTDAFATSRGSETPQQAPGYTVDGTTNTFWQHFNSGSPQRKRIDFIFYRSSDSGVTSLSLDKIEVLTPSVIGNKLQINVDGEALDCSDHYAVLADLNFSYE